MEIDDAVAVDNMELGLKLKYTQKYEEAIFHFDKIIENGPENVLAYKNKAKALHRLNKNKYAIKCFDKLISLNPTNTNAFFEKGKYLSDISKYKKAIIRFDKAIKLDLSYGCTSEPAEHIYQGRENEELKE